MAGDGEWPLEVEQAFLDQLEERWPRMFVSRLDYEPQELTGLEMPAVTMLALSAPDDVDPKTGPAQDVDWGWSVRLYIALNMGYEAGQAQLKDVWPKLQKAVRADPSLGIDGCWARLTDGGAEPEFSETEEWMMKRFVLTVRREELS